MTKRITKKLNRRLGFRTHRGLNKWRAKSLASFIELTMRVLKFKYQPVKHIVSKEHPLLDALKSRGFANPSFGSVITKPLVYEKSDSDTVLKMDYDTEVDPKSSDGEIIRGDFTYFP